MATQIGKGHIYGLTGGTLVNTSSGHVTPNLQTLRLSHSAKVDEIKDQGGEVASMISSGETLECTFDYIPEAATLAGAVKSAQLPVIPSLVTIAGLPVIICGGFADSLNATTWLYVGGGSINGQNDEKWTMSLPLKRYASLTVATAIVA